jgi:hypothetical protein
MITHVDDTIDEPRLNKPKLKAVVHFICSRCDPDELGTVKLHKALYFADMLHFSAHNRALTGVEYLKQPHGPTARHLSWALKELEAEGALQVKTRDFHGFSKQDFIALRKPDPSALSNEEVDLLTTVIDFVCARTAREISELSHNLAWEAVSMGGTIPYFTVLGWALEPVTETDMTRGVAEAKSLAPQINARHHAN